MIVDTQKKALGLDFWSKSGLAAANGLGN